MNPIMNIDKASILLPTKRYSSPSFLEMKNRASNYFHLTNFFENDCFPNESII